jgi:hypothetical protein
MLPRSLHPGPAVPFVDVRERQDGVTGGHTTPRLVLSMNYCW